MLKCVILCISFLVTGSIAGHAPFIKPCPQTDFDCILASAKATLPHLVKGVPDLGIPPLDPLHGNDVSMTAGELKLTFKNVIGRGLSKCNINKIERDPVKSTGFLDIVCPLAVTGDYIASGQLLFVNVEGEGPFEIKGDSMHVNVTIKLKPIIKDGQEYYKITSFDFKYEPLSRFYFKFENLFNGDKAQAEPVEKVLNESWKELLLSDDIGKKVLQEALAQCVKIIDELFLSVPANELEIK